MNLFRNCALDERQLKLQEVDGASYSFCLAYKINNNELVRFGTVSKSLLKKMDINSEVFYGDIYLDILTEIISTKDIIAKEPLRFPEVKRDLSMLLNQSVNYNQVEEVAYAAESKLLKDVNLFDVYEGEKIEAGKKSYAVSFFLADEEATLKDKQIDAAMQRLMDAFESKLGAVIRKE